jgi:alkanesulfonate monooxygenase SsuD/methylene tetrahydromethanopterin reductase-like flavin-dependent oxidoreductase (luciferase family)
VDIRHRGRLADDKLVLLRRLLSDELIVQDGRQMAVTPRPHTAGGPTLMWGGASLAAARRAGRNGLGLLANGGGPGMKAAYEAAALAHDHQPGPVLIPDRDTASVVFVADDVDRAWDEIGAHLLHDARMYAHWNSSNDTSAGLSDVKDVHELRETSKSHIILSVPEAVERLRAGEMLNLSPLCGGLPPELAWPYLKRGAEVVMQHVAAGAPTDTGDGLEEALNGLLRSS